MEEVGGKLKGCVEIRSYSRAEWSVEVIIVCVVPSMWMYHKL